MTGQRSHAHARRTSKRQARKATSFGSHNHGAEIIIANPLGREPPQRVDNPPRQPYPGAHFATFPPSLVKPCIMARMSRWRDSAGPRSPDREQWRSGPCERL